MIKRQKEKTKNEQLTEAILHGIREVKGKDIVMMDMRKLHNASFDYFVICHGTSNTQVEAIADSVLGEVKKHMGISAFHREGYENAEWILLDYSDVVVHVFLDRTREFYQLESLWADAEVTRFENED